jgi:hypothetical protein
LDFVCFHSLRYGESNLYQVAILDSPTMEDGGAADRLATGGAQAVEKWINLFARLDAGLDEGNWNWLQFLVSN